MEPVKVYRGADGRGEDGKHKWFNVACRVAAGVTLPPPFASLLPLPSSQVHFSGDTGRDAPGHLHFQSRPPRPMIAHPKSPHGLSTPVASTKLGILFGGASLVGFP